MRIATASNDAGFTLIEVVVALAILALSLGVIYQSFGWGLRREAWLEQRESAWMAAQSGLADIRNLAAKSVGTQSEQLPSGLTRTTHIAAIADDNNDARALHAFEVTIDVAWGDKNSQRIRLQSIELGRGTP